ncbi:MAG: hypothetical protein H7A54_09265 [Akkermansiaceae bacterium]|nr:hypothetical protein [Akkermansiaceae bacterium]
MKQLFVRLSLVFCAAVVFGGEPSKDPIKLKLSMLDTSLTAPEAFFQPNLLWLLTELGKGRKLDDMVGTKPGEADLKSFEGLAIAARRDLCRESIMKIEDVEVLTLLSETTFATSKPGAGPQTNTAPARPPEPVIPDEVVRAGEERGRMLLKQLYSAEDYELLKERSLQKAFKRIDLAAGKDTSGADPIGNNMPLQRRLDVASSSEVEGRNLILLSLLGSGFTWQEAEQRMEKVADTLVKELDSLPLPSRRWLARDRAYYIDDRDTLMKLDSVIAK